MIVLSTTFNPFFFKLKAFPENENLDVSQEEMIAESVVQEEEGEEGSNKSAKRKVPTAVGKQKVGKRFTAAHIVWF